MLYDVIPIDIEIHVGHFLAAGVEADILQQFFKDRKQAARTDVLLGFVHHVSRVRNGLNSAVLKGKEHLVHCQQCLILPGKRIFGLCQDGLEVLLGQALERHMDGEAALELGNQVRHLGHMERTRRDKEHEIRAHRAVLGVDGAALHDGQDIALYALAADVGAMAAGGAARHLVDFVDKDDALLLGPADGLLAHLILVDELVGFLLKKNPARLLDLDATDFRLFGHHAAHHVADVDGVAAHFQLRQRVLYFDFDFPVLQLPAAQLGEHILAPQRQLVLLLFGEFRLFLAAQQKLKGIACVLLGRVDQQRGQPVLRQDGCTGFHPFGKLVSHHSDSILHEVADDAFHVAAHIAHFGKLGGFHLDERRIDQLGEPAGDLRFAHARGTDHQDVLGTDFIADVLIQLGTAVTVAQSDGHRPLGLILADDVAVELPHDLSGCQFLHDLPPRASQR